MRIKWIPQIVSNIKISSHNQKYLNIDFNILEILQSQLKRVRIDIHKGKKIIIVKERNQQNISMIKNIFSK